MNKERLRKEYREKRLAVSPGELARQSAEIVELTLRTFQLTDKTVSLFLPIDNKREINTYTLWEKIMAIDGFVAVPKVNETKNDLKHILLTDHSQLKTSSWGIPEPQHGKVVAAHKIDYVFVPLLCFDKKGHRVGYGGGFYDRFLKKCQPSCRYIGLSLFEALEDEIGDLLPTDIPLHACVTPKQVYRF